MKKSFLLNHFPFSLLSKPRHPPDVHRRQVPLVHGLVDRGVDVRALGLGDEVLVVDDTPEVRHLVGEILSEHYQVLYAADGEMGWQDLVDDKDNDSHVTTNAYIYAKTLLEHLVATFKIQIYKMISMLYTNFKHFFIPNNIHQFKR